MICSYCDKEIEGGKGYGLEVGIPNGKFLHEECLYHGSGCRDLKKIEEVMMVYKVVEYADGSKRWYFKDQLHREDGPAVICADGTKCWYFKNQRHREDGPAIIYADGTKYWYIKDQLHREDGPAVICADGTKCWYFKDKLHREDGPAIIYADGTKYWWLKGKHYTEQQFKEKIAELKEKK